jgi:hypothetical protein
MRQPSQPLRPRLYAHEHDHTHDLAATPAVPTFAAVGDSPAGGVVGRLTFVRTYVLELTLAPPKHRPTSLCMCVAPEPDGEPLWRPNSLLGRRAACAAIAPQHITQSRQVRGERTLWWLDGRRLATVRDQLPEHARYADVVWEGVAHTQPQPPRAAQLPVPARFQHAHGVARQPRGVPGEPN